MSSSDITVAALTATPTLRGNKCAWTYSDPRNNALPNIGLDMVEVHASTTNDRATATKVGEGITDFLHAGLVEEQTWYYWIKARDYLGGYGSWYPSGSTAGISATATGMSGLAFGLANGKLVASVSGNALTIAVKTAAGSDPSASDPVFVAFRSATLSSGAYAVRALTSALSLVISSGSTLGQFNGIGFRIWVVIFDDAGTVRLGAICCTQVDSTGVSFSIVSLPEYGVRSSTAEGGAGAADSYGVIYTGTAVSSKAFRIIGYLDWNAGLATAGTWDASPDVISLFTPGTKRPGDAVQETLSTSVVNTTTTTQIPFDNTKPQNTEGSNVLAVSLSPSAVVNMVCVRLCCGGSSNTAGTHMVGSITKVGESDARGANAVYLSTANKNGQLTVDMAMQAGTLSQISFSANAGPDIAATLTVKGNAGSNLFGGVMSNSLEASEIMI